MISLIILGIIFLYAIISYNTLTRKRNNVDNAFGSIDVMLKKRFDLIPNLVATVQQYAKHEEETFTKITNLRTKSYDSLTAEEKADFFPDTGRRNVDRAVSGKRWHEYLSAVFQRTDATWIYVYFLWKRNTGKRIFGSDSYVYEKYVFVSAAQLREPTTRAYDV